MVRQRRRVLQICKTGKVPDTSACSSTTSRLQCVRSPTTDRGVSTGIRTTAPVADADWKPYRMEISEGTKVVDGERRKLPRPVQVIADCSKPAIRVACCPSGPSTQGMHTGFEPIQLLHSFKGDELSAEDSCFNVTFDRCGILSVSPGRFPYARPTIAAAGRPHQTSSSKDTTVN